MKSKRQFLSNTHGFCAKLNVLFALIVDRILFVCLFFFASLLRRIELEIYDEQIIFERAQRLSKLIPS